jgi:hypothetical protein
MEWWRCRAPGSCLYCRANTPPLPCPPAGRPAGHSLTTAPLCVHAGVRQPAAALPRCPLLSRLWAAGAGGGWPAPARGAGQCSGARLTWQRDLAAELAPRDVAAEGWCWCTSHAAARMAAAPAAPSFMHCFPTAISLTYLLSRCHVPPSHYMSPCLSALFISQKLSSFARLTFS